MSYLLVAFLIGLLILVHELGHLVAAWVARIPVERFSIGFGRKLWGRRIGQTDYWLAAVPLGGYVLPAIEDENEYFQIPIGRRIVFALGGPLANLLLPVILFAGLNVAADGVSLAGLFVQPWVQTAGMLGRFLGSLPQVFAQPDQLSGVVGIVAIGGQFAGEGAAALVRFSILLSLNLAVLNMLPLPPLDGGKIVLCLLEKVHPRATRLHVPLAVTGWVCLLGLMAYTTLLDVARHLVGSV